jgi:ZIP family zinc transporter
VLEATLWGLLGASSLLLGAILGAIPPFHRWLVARHEWRLGLLMAFGAGVLISAVAYDLVEEAMAASATGIEVGVGFVLGALAFFVGDELIDRLGEPAAAAGSTDEAEDSTGAVAILLGSILDGIPESVVIGISLLGGGSVSVAVLAAVFLSNIPESISASAGLTRRLGTATTLGIWAVVVAVSGLAAGLGYALLGGAPPATVTSMQAFAGGATHAVGHLPVGRLQRVGGRLDAGDRLVDRAMKTFTPSWFYYMPVVRR